MANYYCASRTNYFRVTDEKRYKELMSHLCAEDLHDFTETRDGVTYHGFGSYGSIYYSADDDNENEFPCDQENDMDYFFDELAKILPENEAFILLEGGHEKLRYVSGWALVVTRKGHRYISLENAAMAAARELLNDPEFTTQCSY